MLENFISDEEKFQDKLKSRGKRYNPDEIKYILYLYSEYNGNAKRASEGSSISVCTIIRHWRKGAIQVGGRRREKEYEEAIKESKNQTEVARRLGISRQAVSYYKKRYPDLKFNCRETINAERDNQIKEFIERGMNRKEIAEKLKISYCALENYLLKHPYLPYPRSEDANCEKRKKIEELIGKGIDKYEIAEEMDMHSIGVERYIKRFSRLRKIYDDSYNLRKERSEK